MKLQKILYIIVTKEQNIWNILVNIGTQKILWFKQNQLSKKKKKSLLTARQIKNQPDKMQIQSKKLPTKQSQIKTNLSLSLSLSLSELQDDILQKYCFKLESLLKHDIYYDIDGLDLFSKLKVLKEILQIKEYTLIDILNQIKRLDSFSNTCIAYKILLTIPITVAFREISFSKLKLIKLYLRSTMSQERLSGLVILSIENEMLEELEYQNLINQFAFQMARKIDFK